MEAIRTLLGGPGGFKEWLEGKRPGAIVGDRQEPHRCPLARFLSETGGLSDVSVTTQVFFKEQEGGEEQVLALPGWARSVINLIDDDGRNPHAGVMAKTALRLLQTI